MQISKMNYDYPDKKNRKNLIRNFIDCILDKKKIDPSFKSQVDLMIACLYADGNQIMNSCKHNTDHHAYKVCASIKPKDATCMQFLLLVYIFCTVTHEYMSTFS